MALWNLYFGYENCDCNFASLIVWDNASLDFSRNLKVQKSTNETRFFSQIRKK